MTMVDSDSSTVRPICMIDHAEPDRAEEARKRADRLGSLFAAASEGIVIMSCAGKLIDVNASFARMHGYSVDELQRMRIADLDTPEGTEAAPGRLRRILAGEILRFEVEHRHKQGHLFPLEVSASLIVSTDGESLIQSFHRDITDRRRAEDALRISETSLREAQRLAHIGRWQWTFATDTVTWSEEIYRITGRNPGAPAPGFGEMSSCYTPESWALLNAAVASTGQTGEPYEIDLDMVRPDGTITHTSTRGDVDRDASGRITGLHGTAQDITERKRAENERARLAESNGRLERERRARADLSAFIVHDLKNPLSGVVLNARFLAGSTALGGDEHEAALHVLHAAQSLNRMVNNLLDISRSEDGMLVPRIAEVDLPALLEEVATTTRARVGDAKIELHVNTQSLRAPKVQADADLMRRVFENLADNALRYSPRGGVVAIDAWSSEGDAGVDISVSDSGPGIAAPDRERVFEKYVQLGNRGESRGPDLRAGRGLGLLFCRIAVECHGGRIWVEDAPTGGARFHLRIPAAKT
ncbi:MAG: PAS domain S-box protein [Deltaproteobacteria bacterium]